MREGGSVRDLAHGRGTRATAAAADARGAAVGGSSKGVTRPCYDPALPARWRPQQAGRGKDAESERSGEHAGKSASKVDTTIGRVLALRVFIHTRCVRWRQSHFGRKL